MRLPIDGLCLTLLGLVPCLILMRVMNLRNA